MVFFILVSFGPGLRFPVRPVWVYHNLIAGYKWNYPGVTDPSPEVKTANLRSSTLIQKATGAAMRTV
jgi:hypothetical protein